MPINISCRRVARGERHRKWLKKRATRQPGDVIAEIGPTRQPWVRGGSEGTLAKIVVPVALPTYR
jgi:hypothetical protein